MTDIGYDFVIEKIVNRLITIPNDDYTINMLSAWLSGYAQCQHDVIEIIEEMRKGDDRR